MIEDWELKSLERALKRLEGRIDELEKADRRREERQWWWIGRIWWTLLVAGTTTYVVLAATGHLHHHWLGVSGRATG